LSVIPALGMLRQEEFKIEFLPVYIVRPCLRKEEEIERRKRRRKEGREGGNKKQPQSKDVWIKEPLYA
jgi:hypothetical protein